MNTIDKNLLTLPAVSSHVPARAGCSPCALYCTCRMFPFAVYLHAPDVPSHALYVSDFSRDTTLYSDLQIGGKK